MAKARRLFFQDSKFTDLLAKNIKTKSTTNDGYLAIIVEGTSEGVQEYHDMLEMGGKKNEKVGVYRPLSVFNNNSTFETAVSSAVTIQHPAENVSPDNFKSLAVGYIKEVTAVANGKIYFTLIINDRQAIEWVNDGTLQEVSLGYSCDTIPSKGMYDGKPYEYKFDGFMIINHIALLPKGASRSNVEILDSKGNIMGHTVRKNSDGKWEVVDGKGNVVSTFDSKEMADSKCDALNGKADTDSATDSTPTLTEGEEKAETPKDKEKIPPKADDGVDSAKAKADADNNIKTDAKFEDEKKFRDSQFLKALEYGLDAKEALEKTGKWLQDFNDGMAQNKEVKNAISNIYNNSDSGNPSDNFRDGNHTDSELKVKTIMNATLDALWNYKKAKEIELTPERKKYYDSLPDSVIPYKGKLGGDCWYDRAYLRQAEADGTLEQWSKVLRARSTLDVMALQKDSNFRDAISNSMSVSDLDFQDNALSYTTNALSSINAKWIEEIILDEDWMHLISQEVGSHVKPDLQNIVFHMIKHTGAWNLTSNHGGAPLVSIDTSTTDIKTFRAGADIDMSYNEIKESAILGINYQSSLLTSSAQAFNEFMYSVITTGKTTFGDVVGEGLFNATGVDITALGTITISTVTGDQLVEHIQKIIKSVYKKFKGKLSILKKMGLTKGGNYMYLALPPEIYVELGDKRISGTMNGMTALEFLLTKNAFALAKIPFNIFSEDSLVGAGAGGINRMMLGAKSADIVSYAMPIPPRLAPPEKKTDSIIMATRCQFTGVVIKLPFALEYADYTSA